jgi:predicted enzyme related to lactoylglutathione lyase
MSIQGRVVWHDLNTTDLDKSKRFYGELFAWSFKTEGQWSFIALGNDPQHFGTVNLLDPKFNVPAHWVPYITVEDIDTAIATVTKAGGKIQLPKTPAGKTGNFSYVYDPQNAMFALWQYNEIPNKPELDTPPPAGSFCWDELVTSDPDAAEKFYGTVVGYKTEHMEMPGMRYTLWLRPDAPKRPDGKPRQAGGMMKLPPMVPQPFWLSYVAVADCDQSVEKAKRLGGTLAQPATDIPNVGRFACLLDPTSAAIAILGPNK